jgi:signal transduction histidine kinase
MSNKKYENFKLLIRDHPVIYSIIIAIIIIFLVLVLSQNLFGLKFVNYYNKDINIIYAFGIISSLIIMFVLLINNKKIANYKNWSILVSTILLVLMLFIQIFYPDISIIGSGLSLITLFQYFTMENPDLKYIEELNILKNRAEEANEAKTNFLASMSHEIRTPMNAIIGLSETLLNGSIPNEYRDDIKSINEAGNTLLEIVNNIYIHYLCKYHHK